MTGAAGGERCHADSRLDKGGFYPLRANFRDMSVTLGPFGKKLLRSGACVNVFCQLAAGGGGGGVNLARARIRRGGPGCAK